MKNTSISNSKTKFLGFKSLALTSISLVPVCLMMQSVTAHAQVVNNATATGTPAAGNLTDATASESVTVFEILLPPKHWLQVRARLLPKAKALAS